MSTDNATRIYNQAMGASNQDGLKAASNLVDAMQKWPSLWTDDTIEALAAMLREAGLQKIRVTESYKTARNRAEQAERHLRSL